MSTNPIILVIRFLLEIGALVAMGWWGWHQGDSVLRYVWALGIPIVAATLWGTFTVPHDPGRGGGSPVPVPGFLRLTLEALFFGFATWCLGNSGAMIISWVFGVVVVVHYIVSYDRIIWMVKQV